MTEPVFSADPLRLLIAAAVGIILLLVLIIKFKFHPVISMMIAAIVVGVGAGMPLNLIGETVEKGVGRTLQGIALLIGLGSMFGGILEVSGGAQKIAKTLIDKLGQNKAGWALGFTGIVIGMTVFFEAGVVILIPLAFNVAKQTKKSTLCYAIPLLAGLASGYAFIPPSAGSVLVANSLGVGLGTMIAVGIPVAIVSTVIAGIVWGKIIGNKIYTQLPVNVAEVKDDEESKLPPFGLVLVIILIPLILILLSTISSYLPVPESVQEVLAFLGELIFLVIASGGVIRWMLQDSGLGNIIGPALEQSGMPLIIVGFLIAFLVRASVGSSIVAMTMASGIMATMSAAANCSTLYLAAMCCAICGGATALSHVNDAGFWLVSTFLEVDEKTTLKSWTVMETLIGITGLVLALIISIFA